MASLFFIKKVQSMNNTEYKRDFFKEAHAILRRQGYKNYIERLLPAGKWKSGEYIVKNPTNASLG